MNYIFTSERLGFRTWLPKDIQPFAAINSDAEVMKYFPSTYGIAKTTSLILNMNTMYEEKGYCYFGVDIFDTSELIGFIGIAYQDYEAPFTPAVDIGWRLAKSYWGKGYATEGARKCLEYSFDRIGLSEIVSVATTANLPSINVMKKIGMNFDGEFEHPALADYPELGKCSLYRIKK